MNDDGWLTCWFWLCKHWSVQLKDNFELCCSQGVPQTPRVWKTAQQERWGLLFSSILPCGWLIGWPGCVGFRATDNVEHWGVSTSLSHHVHLTISHSPLAFHNTHFAVMAQSVSAFLPNCTHRKIELLLLLQAWVHVLWKCEDYMYVQTKDTLVVKMHLHGSDDCMLTDHLLLRETHVKTHNKISNLMKW